MTAVRFIFPQRFTRRFNWRVVTASSFTCYKTKKTIYMQLNIIHHLLYSDSLNNYRDLTQINHPPPHLRSSWNSLPMPRSVPLVFLFFYSFPTKAASFSKSCHVLTLSPASICVRKCVWHDMQLRTRSQQQQQLPMCWKPLRLQRREPSDGTGSDSWYNVAMRKSLKFLLNVCDGKVEKKTN